MYPLSAFFLFEGLDEAALTTIAAKLEPPVTYRRGQVVYSTDSFRRAIGLILCGSVTVRSKSDAAHGVVINRLNAGELFGVAALFDDGEDPYVTEITADGDTVVQFLPQQTVSQLMAEYPIISERYIRFLSGRIRFLNRKLSALTLRDTEARLYHYFVAHVQEDGTVRLPDKMTELAGTLNMGRSSLYRALDTLLRDGILQKEGKQYRIL